MRWDLLKKIVNPVEFLLPGALTERTQVLMQRWVGQFRDIFDQDNYHPIAVSSSLEWRDVTASFPYESSSLEASPFPKQFPFSAMVPRFEKVLYCNCQKKENKAGAFKLLR